MQRREFITLLGGAAATWPLAARAQQDDRVLRIGVLMSLLESDPQAQSESAAFERGLQELGWIPGRNIQIVYRWAGADINRARTYAHDLVELHPEVILSRSTPQTAALQQETSTIPIVFVVVADPIGSGFAKSLARPGGNITGFTNLEASMGGKWLQLLKDVSPDVARVAFVFNPKTAPYAESFVRSAETAARSLAMEMIATPIQNGSELEDAIAVFARQPGGSLVGITDSFIIEHRDLIISLAARYRLPAIYPYRYFAAGGGLLSYGIDTADQLRQSASYIDHILKGTAVTDLPVQLPSKFELVINLKTAKALGLTVPAMVLARADKVIE
jgi:putative tryptophan/tyrosine transport system substrate-binding protein